MSQPVTKPLGCLGAFVLLIEFLIPFVCGMSVGVLIGTHVAGKHFLVEVTVQAKPYEKVVGVASGH